MYVLFYILMCFSITFLVANQRPKVNEKSLKLLYTWSLFKNISYSRAKTLPHTSRKKAKFKLYSSLTQNSGERIKYYTLHKAFTRITFVNALHLNPQKWKRNYSITLAPITERETKRDSQRLDAFRPCK